MKRLALLVCLVVMLSGCRGTSDAMSECLAFRDKLLNSNGCSFQTEITADYGDAIHLFSMDITADSQGNADFSIIGPESISQITGSISQSGAALTFDEVALAFPLLADGQLSPVASPWIFLKTLRSGYITSVCREGTLLHMTIDDSYADDALTLDIWIDDAQLPVHAQVLYREKSILSLSVKNFHLL